MQLFSKSLLLLWSSLQKYRNYYLTKMEITFEGKRILVTGASRESLQKEAPGVEIVPVDLSDWKKTEEAFNSIGNIDLLVNNAGLAVLKPLTDFSEDEVDQLLNINVKAVINLTKLYIKQCLDRKVPGSVVNISSLASVVGALNHSVYSGSKGAVDAFSRGAALEYGPNNIRVNCVNPTVVLTDMGKIAWSDPKTQEHFLQKTPLRRFGELEDVVNATLFLLSDKSSMTTGSIFLVDGGYMVD